MIEILMGAAAVVVALVAVAVQSQLMSRQAFAGFLLALVLAVSGANLILSLDAKNSFKQELSSVCNGQQEIARTGAEALEELRESNTTFLLKGSIPGYSRKELAELTARKAAKEAGRIKRLETVANNTCKGR